ncbi:hypothetical protein [Alkalihalobacillus sp. CinArs1]|uniref:hypothetical protein n=1 Tax=Alkalihalobacillus sp. CinArs1 TaxID=2995314 RepID=UPI0022DD6D96|nr:hypothetical protein [Alkalihalobacillus sp. CinArs1]
MTLIGIIMWGSIALLVILGFALEKIFGMKKPTKSDRQTSESAHILDRARDNSGPPV